MDEQAGMNERKNKQPWKKFNRLSVGDKDGVSAMALNRKAVRSINNFDNGQPLRNANPGRLRVKEKRADAHKAKSEE